MSKQIVTWFIENVERDGTEQGHTFYADQDYVPSGLRLMARQAPDTSAMTCDIKDDGTTILSQTARLPVGIESEGDADEFPNNPPTILAGSLVTLDLVAGGAKGITVQLELETVDEQSS